MLEQSTDILEVIAQETGTAADYNSTDTDLAESVLSGFRNL